MPSSLLVRKFFFCWPCMLSFGWKVWYIRRYEVKICLFKIILVKVQFSRKNVSKCLGRFVRGLLTSYYFPSEWNDMRLCYFVGEKKQCVKWLKAKPMNFGILHSADIIVTYKLVLWSIAKTLVGLWTWTILQSKVTGLSNHDGKARLWWAYGLEPSYIDLINITTSKITDISNQDDKARIWLRVYSY